MIDPNHKILTPLKRRVANFKFIFLHQFWTFCCLSCRIFAFSNSHLWHMKWSQCLSNLISKRGENAVKTDPAGQLQLNLMFQQISLETRVFAPSLQFYSLHPEHSWSIIWTNQNHLDKSKSFAQIKSFGQIKRPEMSKLLLTSLQ